VNFGLAIAQSPLRRVNRCPSVRTTGVFFSRWPWRFGETPPATSRHNARNLSEPLWPKTRKRRSFQAKRIFHRRVFLGSQKKQDLVPPSLKSLVGLIGFSAAEPFAGPLGGPMTMPRPPAPVARGRTTHQLYPCQKARRRNACNLAPDVEEALLDAG